MWIEHELTRLKLQEPSAITIGAFDGVHRGHQALITQMVAEGCQQGLHPLVITFDPLPGQVLGRGDYGLLSTPEERIMRIGELGVEGVVVLPFNRSLMQTPAQDFVEQVRVHLALKGLWVGPDFTLGRNREGDVAFLEEAGRHLGFQVHVLTDVVRWEGRPVRSSRIRRALKSGAIEEANGCLGYTYHLSGTVKRGDQRGRALGFPTANLDVVGDRLLPANGVYICRAHLDTGTFNAITNIGTRPTFNNGEPTVEAYLLDFPVPDASTSGDLYGAAMRLDFLKYLRPELRFPSAEALIEQMREDEAVARAWLTTHASDTPDQESSISKS